MTDDRSFDLDIPPDHRSGFVAVIGRPNVGKSTLVNRLVGQKVAIVSPKPQTTRSRILAILTREDAQVIFVDTPGLHRPRHKLGEVMVATATRAVPDADVVMFVVDVSAMPDHSRPCRVRALHRRASTRHGREWASIASLTARSWKPGRSWTCWARFNDLVSSL